MVDFDLSPNSFTLSAPGTLPNIYICKLTSTGNLLWAQQIGNTNDDRAYSIALNSAEDAIYTTGKFQGSLVDFDPTAGVFTMNATSTEDFFIQKMSQCAPLLTSIASTSIACNSNTNGSATITANGGSGFSYTWSPSGGNAAIASGLSVGVYTCVVTNSCGSASTKTVNVTAPSPINLTITATNTLVCSGKPSTLTASANGGSGAISYNWVAGPSASVNIINPLVSTTYTVNASDANSCIKTQTINIAVNPLPTVSVNSGSICSGNSFTILPSGANAYTIQGGLNIVSPTSSTNYTVIGVSAAGCLSANSATSSVAVNPLPNVTIATSNTLICVGQSASLTANGASTYTWSNNSSGATIVVNPTVTASFTVFGTAANTCTSLATLNQNVSPCTNFGATIKGDFSDIIVYPNPSNGVVFISGLKANEKINLYNSIGIEVPYLISNSDTIFRLEIKNNSNTSNGVYFLKINNSIYKLLLLF